MIWFLPAVPDKMISLSSTSPSMTVCWSPPLRQSFSAYSRNAMRRWQRENWQSPSLTGRGTYTLLMSGNTMIHKPLTHCPRYRVEFRVKKEGWGGGSTRVVVFQKGQGDLAQLKPGGKTLAITIGDGLPKSSSKLRDKKIKWNNKEHHKT